MQFMINNKLIYAAQNLEKVSDKSYKLTNSI